MDLAGLTHVVWLRPGSHLIQLAPYGWAPDGRHLIRGDYFGEAASAAGATYRYRTTKIVLFFRVKGLGLAEIVAAGVTYRYRAVSSPGKLPWRFQCCSSEPKTESEQFPVRRPTLEFQYCSSAPKSSPVLLGAPSAAQFGCSGRPHPSLVSARTIDYCVHTMFFVEVLRYTKKEEATLPCMVLLPNDDPHSGILFL